MRVINWQIKLSLATVLLILIAFLIAGCGSNSGAGSDSKELYTCGMHPSVIQEGPGLCPICNMHLTPLGQGDGDDSSLTIDPSVVQSMGVRFETVKRQSLKKGIRAAAHVAYNEDKLAVLSARTDGWIEKLHVSSPGKTVKAGDPLFDFYSPKLYSAQEEYLIALRSGEGSLISASRERLQLLGVSDERINRIRKEGAKKSTTMTAPIDGVVVELGSSSTGGASDSGGGDMSGMSGMGGSSGGGNMDMSSGTMIREGDYISSGTAVFTIADLSSLWVYAHIYEDELPYVKEGMKATLELDYLSSETFEGTVDFVYPFLDKKTRDIKLRLTFDNPDGKLLPEMYGKVLIESEIDSNALVIPKEAVIHSGDKRIVFLKLPEGKFSPVEVSIGATDDQGNVQIKSGLEEGQVVVTSAQFLLDSESRLKEALNKMLAGGDSAGSPDEHNHGGSGGWVDLAPDDPTAKFACPMESDKYYTSEDGDCPVCGMHLEEHDPVKWKMEHSN